MKKTLIIIGAIILVVFLVNNLLNLKLFSGRNCSSCFIWSDNYETCNSYCISKGRGGCSTVRLLSANCPSAPYFPECNISYECICRDNSCRIGVYTEGCSACLGSGGSGSSGAGFDDIDGDYGNWHDPNWL